MGANEYGKRHEDAKKSHGKPKWMISYKKSQSVDLKET